ncbi:DUF3618 domain-containing protein [Actinoplanes friuliensis]|jgi:hypothetical protein|uniref:DUF3618 domain-containing protein n=1 Tax=Actinoplanes friuliensis DSM 7358 TaxID=1246995 RepID=U5VTE4_9ACTN|nr:DUF3618 domain-containing protein [Actinoplanes friuliensis]AGZ39010.1 hypothetical protein AFR_03605 [Actinoplanes friuliensis DSM 7358]
MSSDVTVRLNGSTPGDPARLKAEIEQTRQELGETAAALAAKTDVKTRAAALAGRVRERVVVTADEIKQDPAQAVRRPVPVALLATVAAAVAVVLVRRSRS